LGFKVGFKEGRGFRRRKGVGLKGLDYQRAFIFKRFFTDGITTSLKDQVQKGGH